MTELTNGSDVSLIPTWILIWLDHILALHKNAFMGIGILNLSANEKQKVMMDDSNPVERRAEKNTVSQTFTLRCLHLASFKTKN